MDMNIPFARGRMRALSPRMNAMLAEISSIMLSKPNSKTQKTKGILRCPAIRMVAHAGPSSARRGAKSRLQCSQFLLGVV